MVHYYIFQEGAKAEHCYTHHSTHLPLTPLKWSLPMKTGCFFQNTQRCVNSQKEMMTEDWWRVSCHPKTTEALAYEKLYHTSCAWRETHETHVTHHCGRKSRRYFEAHRNRDVSFESLVFPKVGSGFLGLEGNWSQLLPVKALGPKQKVSCLEVQDT